MGDPTNLAARLTARAEPGTVLVARAALERTGRPFETEDAGTITVKGKTQQIPVAVVTGHGGATTLAEQLTPFVGRHDEKRAPAALRRRMPRPRSAASSRSSAPRASARPACSSTCWTRRRSPCCVRTATGTAPAPRTAPCRRCCGRSCGSRPSARAPEAGERLATGRRRPLPAPRAVAAAARTGGGRRGRADRPRPTRSTTRFRAERTAEIVSDFLLGD